MLGIEGSTRNEARWNFLDGTILIRNPECTIGDAKPLPAQTGPELAVRSVYTQRNDCTRLTTAHFFLPNFTCAISKGVLFQFLDKLCNTAKINAVIKQMLDDFVRKLIAGNYFIQSKGETPSYAFEQGDFLRLILTHDMTTSSEFRRDYKSKSMLHEQSDLAPQLVELDEFNLLTLFGESKDLTNYEFDVDDFKYYDLFDENGEVYADTLWSSVDHGDMTARDEHGCLMSLYDVYTVSTLSSPFEPLTVMSALHLTIVALVPKLRCLPST